MVFKPGGRTVMVGYAPPPSNISYCTLILEVTSYIVGN